MNANEYFEQKSNVTQAQDDLKNTIEKLVSKFDDNFYFKLNKRDTITNEKLNCNLTISFFIPHLNTDVKSEKKVTEILFLANLNFNKSHALQLTDFTGFKLTAKTRELNQDRMLFMMYPEIKIGDLPPHEDSTYAIFKNVIEMKQQHMAASSFTDFCREMSAYISPIIKQVSVHTQNHTIDYTLRAKEHAVVMSKFDYAFNNLMKSIDTGKQFYINLDNFGELLTTHTDMEKKRLLHNLDSSLEIKQPKSIKNKI